MLGIYITVRYTIYYKGAVDFNDPNGWYEAAWKVS